jgi:hypothetical protein
VEEEEGIYREEVLLILGALADIRVGVRTIVRYIEEDDDGEEEEVPEEDT